MKKTYKWGEIDLKGIYKVCKQGYEVLVNSKDKTLEFVKPENIQTKSVDLILDSLQ